MTSEQKKVRLVVYDTRGIIVLALEALEVNLFELSIQIQRGKKAELNCCLVFCLVFFRRAL